jgi:hypothetical protein
MADNNVFDHLSFEASLAEFARRQGDIESLVLHIRPEMVKRFMDRQTAKDNIETITKYMVDGLDESDRLCILGTNTIMNCLPPVYSRDEKLVKLLKNRTILLARLNRYAVKLIDYVYGDSDYDQIDLIGEDMEEYLKNLCQPVPGAQKPVQSIASDHNSVVNDDNDEESMIGISCLQNQIDCNNDVGEKRIRVDDEECDDNDDDATSVDTDIKETDKGFECHQRPKANGSKKERKSYSDKTSTPKEAINPLKPLLKKYFEGKTILEPFAGEGEIVDIISTWGFNIIGMDKVGRFKVENYDFETFDEFPAHDVSISNPPWSIKYVVLEKLLSLGKPFMILLPLCCLSTTKFDTILKKYNTFFDIGIISPSPAFIYENKKVRVDTCAWFVARATGQPGIGFIMYLNEVHKLVGNN